MRFTILAVLFTSATMHTSRAEDKGGSATNGEALPLAVPFDSEKARAAQETWARSIGKSRSVEKNSIGMELFVIPPGKFRMGSPNSEEGRYLDENQVDVTLTKPFLIGKTEVTQGQWRALMGSTPWKGRRGVREGDEFAATYVTWESATEFCSRLGDRENSKYRLPTEAEWEYACRAGTTTTFSFGDDDRKLSDYAWWMGNTERVGEKFAEKVGRKKANAFGLHDMHGNVWEWCEDVYREKLAGGRDPLVDSGDSLRVLRGGGWWCTEYSCRSARRSSSIPGGAESSTGFRVVSPR